MSHSQCNIHLNRNLVDAHGSLVFGHVCTQVNVFQSETSLAPVTYDQCVLCDEDEENPDNSSLLAMSGVEVAALIVR